jgi:endonuclease YncB( thermonuclease family)
MGAPILPLPVRGSRHHAAAFSGVDRVYGCCQRCGRARALARRGDPCDRWRLPLDGIDAPEICQAYGLEARAALQRWVKGRELELQVLRTDDYGRPITRVTLQGADVARALVREGHAWSYRWRRSPGPYAQEEAEARSAGRGLFAAREPQRPYDFRRSHGPCERR